MSATESLRPLLDRLRAHERAEIEQTQVLRRGALDGARTALQRIGESVSAAAMLERAPAELAECCGYRQVMLGTVVDGALTGLIVHVPGHATAAEWREVTIKLAYPLVEAEVLRTDAAREVDVERTPRRSPAILRERLGWTRYVVAPVTHEGRARWLLHADVSARPHTAAAADRDAVATYARGVGRALEVAFLRQTLRAYRSDQTEAARWLLDRLERTSDATEISAASLGDAGYDELTAREEQVIHRLARGFTNAAIAQELVVSERTVKYHVANILRKLRASSRADAVARYLRTKA